MPFPLFPDQQISKSRNGRDHLPLAAWRRFESLPPQPPLPPRPSGGPGRCFGALPGGGVRQQGEQY